MIAFTPHNFPEGLAVGVGYGAGDPGSAHARTIGIGLQNLPDGLAVAVALASGATRARGVHGGTPDRHGRADQQDDRGDRGYLGASAPGSRSPPPR